MTQQSEAIEVPLNSCVGMIWNSQPGEVVCHATKSLKMIVGYEKYCFFICTFSVVNKPQQEGIPTKPG